MASINKVILIGNVGQDPEVRYLQDGKAVCAVSLATNEKWKKDGVTHEDVQWHRLVFWERTAEVVGEYVRKGTSIYVEGKLATREYEDKDGVKRRVTEIIVRDMKLLGVRSESEDKPADKPASRPADKPASRPAGKPKGGIPDMDDDIPF